MEGYARLGVELVELMPMGPDPAGWVAQLGERVVPKLAEIDPARYPQHRAHDPGPGSPGPHLDM